MFCVRRGMQITGLAGNASAQSAVLEIDFDRNVCTHLGYPELSREEPGRDKLDTELHCWSTQRIEIISERTGLRGIAGSNYHDRTFSVLMSVPHLGALRLAVAPAVR